MDKENVVIYKLLAWDPPYAVGVALKRQKDQKKKRRRKKEKENVVHAQWNVSHKKEWNDAIYSNMDGLGGHDAKWNKLEKDKYCVISPLYGI